MLLSLNQRLHPVIVDGNVLLRCGFKASRRLRWSCPSSSDLELHEEVDTHSAGVLHVLHVGTSHTTMLHVPLGSLSHG